MSDRLSEMRGDQAELERIYMNIYANPVDVLSERSTLEYAMKLD